MPGAKELTAMLSRLGFRMAVVRQRSSFHDTREYVYTNKRGRTARRPGISGQQGQLVYELPNPHRATRRWLLIIHFTEVSGGFLEMAQFVADELGLHYAFANELELDSQGCFTGKTIGPVQLTLGIDQGSARQGNK